MKRSVLVAVFLLCLVSLSAQNEIDKILASIEKNNASIQAFRQNADALKIGNKTGLWPSNPEAGYGYLWGTPSAIGDRKDVNFVQTFDFPSAYVYRNQISGIRNLQVETEYRKEMKDILYRAKMVCLDLIYTNVLYSDYSRRSALATRVAGAYRVKFAAGDCSLLDKNKAELNLGEIAQELKHLEAERNALLTELAGLNGGTPVDLKDTLYPLPVLPADFEQWYAGMESAYPGIKWLQQEKEISKKDEKLAAALALPTLSTGYMSEKVVGEHFQGITAGLTIPLWADKNKVKFMRAKSLATEGTAAATRLEYHQKLKAWYDRAVELKKIAEDSRALLAMYNNSGLLLIALEKGEISLIEYILENSVYYQNREKIAGIERELHGALTELYRYN